MFSFGFRQLKFVPKSVIASLRSTFTDHEIERIAARGTLVHLEAGTKLAAEGAAGREAFVIVEGSVEVSKGDESVAVVNNGGVIGEMALLSGEARSATVQAVTEVNAYVFTSAEFAALLDDCPTLAGRVATTAIRRLARS